MIKNEYLISIISKVILMATNLITTMALSRYLGPILKGEFAYINNIVSILTIILGFGLEQSYGYFYKKKIENFIEKYVSIMILLDGLYFIIIFLLNIYSSDMIIHLVSILTLINIVSSQISYILIIENINMRNKILLISNVFYSAAIVLIYLMFPKKIIYPFIVLIIKILFEITLYLRTISVRVKYYSFNFLFAKKTFKLGLPAMVMSLMITFNYNIDIIILKGFVDFGQIGLYSTGVALANLAWIFSDAFKDVLFSKTAKKDGVSDVLFAIKINFIIAIGIIFGFIFLGKYIIVLINGIQFIDSFKVTLIILIGTIPMIFFKMINTIYINNGEQAKSLKILTVSVVINIVFNFLLIPNYGICGAAFASVLSYFLCGVVFSIMFSKQYNFHYYEYFHIDKNLLKKIKNRR